MTYLSKGGVILDYWAQYDSPLGPLLLKSDGKYLTGLYMNRELPEGPADLPVFCRAVNWLDAYFQGQSPVMDVPLKLEGTAFQRRVWQLLPTIPYGEIRTYGDLAKEVAEQMGKEKMSAQAVGQAVGKNPVGILVPCHRVVGAEGGMTGYGGGLENKIWLLTHEGWQIREKKLIGKRSK